MKIFAVRSFPHFPAAILALVLCAPAARASDPGAGGLERHFSIEGKTLVLGNLIGEVRVEPSSASAYEIDVAIRGKDATAERISFDEGSGEDAHLYIRFPTGEGRTFIYPPLGNSQSTVMEGRAEGKDDSGHLLDFFLPGHQRSIRVRGTGRGLEVWADVVVRVPEGKAIRVRHGVGDISAEAVAGMCDLDTQAGSVSVQRIDGRVRIDTGSGGVRASEINGELSIDTGSGNVDAARCKGPRVLIDTGSGSVRVAEIQCEELSIDTGSGGIEGGKIDADAAKIDTGSGSVSVAFSRMGGGSFLIDTGSGSVGVHLPVDASADIVAETGSGGIRVEIPNARIIHKSDDRIALVVGSGAAKVRVDTGSGAVRIEQ